MTKKADKVVEGEDLNVLVGSMRQLRKQMILTVKTIRMLRKKRKELRQIYFHF